LSKLFTPIKIRSVEFRNRIWIAPMCMYACENRDGIVGDFHYVHHNTFANGGAGLIIAEATGVTAAGRISPWCPGIYNDEQVAAWKVVTDGVHSRGAKIALQLAHAGRKASTNRGWPGYESGSVAIADGGWQTVSATSKAFPGYAAPRELETEEIPELVAAFAVGARRAVSAGFDAVQIHAAHGYLVHQFLSPITNQRTDRFGGSLENRARLLVEIVAAIRAEVGSHYPVMVRFSATDYREDGLTVDQTAQIAKWCDEAGADFFDISSGGLIPGVHIPVGPGYQVPLAEYVAEHSGSPVGAVGQITDAKQAEAILENGQISVISIARAALANPFWPALAAHQLGEKLGYWPKPYARANFDN